MISTLRRGLLVLLAALPLMANAAGSAHELVQDTTSKMLADLTANKEQYKQDPTKFYDSLNTIVGPVVDAEGISRSIMTVKYSRKATPAQMQTFQENFKKGLFQFYGNALLEYNNQGITVDPAKDESGDRTSIGMTVKGSNGAIYPVQYTLEKVSGEWKLRNVIINGINIGKLFRDQFADAMQRNGNDLDKTINGWAGEVAKAKEETDKAAAPSRQSGRLRRSRLH
jgi:phospholipid transport system substrate-binding protein